MYWTCILKSESTGRFYVGQTSDLPGRLLRHNEDRSKSTKNRGPWRLVHQEGFDTRAEAIARESEIKSWKSRTRIEALINEEEHPA